MTVGMIVVLAWVGLQPATADETTGHIDGAGAFGINIDVPGGDRVNTVLFTLQIGDSLIEAYCVELDVFVSEDVDMVQSPWADFPDASSSFNDNHDQVGWIVENSYPHVSLAELESTLDPAGDVLHGGLSEEEAITATQAAIWHFTDDLVLTADGVKDEVAVAADVMTAYDHLVGEDNLGSDEKVAPALSLAPAPGPGTAGDDPVGPVTVSLTGNVTESAIDAGGLPSGATVQDADGEPVTTAADGSDLYVAIPGDELSGSARLTATATAPVTPVGALFVAEGYANEPHQSVIAASAAGATATVTDEVTVSWNAATTTVVDEPEDIPVEGRSLTLSTTVSTVNADESTPEGTVQLSLGGEDVGEPVELDDDGRATTSVLAPASGALPLEAAYTSADEEQWESSSGERAIDVLSVEEATSAVQLSADRETVDQGDRVTLEVVALDANGVLIGDVTKDAQITSSVDTDQVVGHVVTFPHASPHTLTATFAGHVDSLTIEVTPSMVPGEVTPADRTPSLPYAGGVDVRLVLAAAVLIGLGVATTAWSARRRTA